MTINVYYEGNYLVGSLKTPWSPPLFTVDVQRYSIESNAVQAAFTALEKQRKIRWTDGGWQCTNTL